MISVSSCPACGYAERINRTLDLFRRYDHFHQQDHRIWLLNEIARTLLTDPDDADGSAYPAFVAESRCGPKGPNTVEWEEGRCPDEKEVA